MRFPLGKPILVLLIATAISGWSVLTRPTPPRADLILWSFAETHAKTFRDPYQLPTTGQMPSLADQFQIKTGHSVAISLMGQMGENVRLASAFMSRSTGPTVPDLCEIEIDSIGQFLRPPNGDIGLLPLNDFLKNSGWSDRIVPTRFAPWSKTDPRTGEPIIYGIPADVHPVSITYRKDLFDEAAINPEQARTWTQFQDLCVALQKYRAAHGRPDSRAIALSSTSPDEIVEMLLQRHVNLIDPSNHLHFTDPKLLQTVMFYAQLIAGPRAIGADVSPGIAWTSDLARGNVCAVCTPDWKAQIIRQFAPELAGKLRMMPLPRFDPTDAPTSTLGGTMIGICRASPHPNQAWNLLQFLYLSPEANQARLAAGDDVLPAIPEYWTNPIYHRPDPFFAANQSTSDLYVQLASQIPERYVTPYTFQAELALTAVVRRAEDFISTRGPSGLEQACANWLNEAQDDLQRRIDFGKFNP